MFHVVSKNRKTGLRLRHDTLIAELRPYYAGATVTERNDYPSGYEATLTTPDGRAVHFTLNKEDKEIGAWQQDRTKVPGYSKNGYLLTFTGHAPDPALLRRLGATEISTA